MASQVKAEIILAAMCREEGLPSPQFEYKFHDARKWRFDLAWPKEMVAVEIEGNAWSTKGGGKHMRQDDFDKYNEAEILGWLVLRFTPQVARTENAVATIKRAIEHESIRWKF